MNSSGNRENARRSTGKITTFIVVFVMVASAAVTINFINSTESGIQGDLSGVSAPSHSGQNTSANQLPSIIDPTALSQQDSISLPSASQIYLYGFQSGGSYPTSYFENGEIPIPSNPLSGPGYIMAGLATTRISSNNYSTQCASYVIAGVGVDNYSSMFYNYSVSGKPVSLSVSSGSLVVVVQDGGNITSPGTGIPNLIVASSAVGSPYTPDISLSYAYVSPGSYIFVPANNSNYYGVTLTGVFVFQALSTQTSTLPQINNPTALSQETSMTLPSGSQLYLYGFETGGNVQTSNFTNGEIAIAKAPISGAGYYFNGLAMTTINQNSYTTSCVSYVIAGLGVSNYSAMEYNYSTRGMPVNFTINSQSLVVVVQDGNVTTGSGIPGLVVAASAVGVNGWSQISISYVYLNSGSYEFTPTNHNAAVTGIFMFQKSTLTASLPVIGSPSALSQQNSISLPLGSQIYLYGFQTGGQYFTSKFNNGSVNISNNPLGAGGSIFNDLAVTTINQDNYTTDCASYVTAGVGVSGYSSMRYNYSISGRPINFTINSQSLVVIIQDGGNITTPGSGISGLLDVANVVGSNGWAAISVSYAYVNPGSYEFIPNQVTPYYGVGVTGMFLFKPSLAHNVNVITSYYIPNSSFTLGLPFTSYITISNNESQASFFSVELSYQFSYRMTLAIYNSTIYSTGSLEPNMSRNLSISLTPTLIPFPYVYNSLDLTFVVFQNISGTTNEIQTETINMTEKIFIRSHGNISGYGTYVYEEGLPNDAPWYIRFPQDNLFQNFSTRASDFNLLGVNGEYSYIIPDTAGMQPSISSGVLLISDIYPDYVLFSNSTNIAQSWNPFLDSYNVANWNSVWSSKGNCYGISSTLLLFYIHYILHSGSNLYGELYPTQVPSVSASDQINIGSNITLNNATLLITLFQCFGPSSINDAITSFTEGNSSISEIRYFVQNDTPVLLGLGNTTNGSELHAVIAWGISNLSNGLIGIEISDPNVPQTSTIALYNPNIGSFSYTAARLSFNEFKVLDSPVQFNYNWLFNLPFWPKELTNYTLLSSEQNSDLAYGGRVAYFDGSTLINNITGVAAVNMSSQSSPTGFVQVFAVPDNISGKTHIISDPIDGISLSILGWTHSGSLSYPYEYSLNISNNVSESGTLKVNVSLPSFDSLNISSNVNTNMDILIRYGSNSSSAIFSVKNIALNEGYTEKLFVSNMNLMNSTSTSYVSIGYYQRNNTSPLQSYKLLNGQSGLPYKKTYVSPILLFYTIIIVVVVLALIATVFAMVVHRRGKVTQKLQ